MLFDCQAKWPSGSWPDNTIGGSRGILRWNPSELGFFDPNYNSKSVSTGSTIKYTGKEIYF